MTTAISDYLARAAEADCIDLFLNAGKVPSWRRNGLIERVGDEIVTGEAIDAFRKSVAGAAGNAVYAQTGSCDAACSLPGGRRFRINFFASLTGPAMAVRPLREGGNADFAALHLPEALRRACETPRGLILVAGATGSGKSTTLAAMVNHINTQFARHILTLEDPIEFLHRDRMSLVNQREISPEGGFAAGLRSAMRENPDVIIIGEMRDAETMEAAINAALTGHLVISTVHTGDTVQAVERIVNQFPDARRERAAADLALALIGMYAQRLMPRADGSGMIPAVEILPGTPSVRKMVSDRNFGGLDELLRGGSSGAAVSFARAIFRLFRDGLVERETARTAADNPEEFDLLCKGMERGVDAFRSTYGGENDDAEGEIVDMQRLLRTAIRQGASDLVLTNGVPPTLRISGELCALDLPPLAGSDIPRLLFSILTPRQRVAFEEKRELDFALAAPLPLEHGAPEQVCRFRLNAFYQRGNIGVVARVIPTRIPEPAELGLPEALSRLIEKQQGLILVTGPTGSGKSTTLASLIDQINRRWRRHIITIEDPIEYVHEHGLSVVEQREMFSDTLSFAEALRHVLRQAPDVIMVGEMRDSETMAAALTAAETGHLVFATVHTNSAPQTIDRIIDSFPQAHQNQIRIQLSAVLLAVVSQRLIPRTDGAGRVAAFEVMVGTPPVQALIREGRTHQLTAAIEVGYKDGMRTMLHALEELYAAGAITRADMERLTVDYKQVTAF